jgi:hypothetical protein
VIEILIICALLLVSRCLLVDWAHFIVGHIEYTKSVQYYVLPVESLHYLVQPLRHGFRLVEVHDIRHCKC